MKIGKCRLCLQEKNLINKSHILSDFFYKNIYGNDHDLYRVSFANPRHNRRVDTGEFEGGILCKDCDNRILSNYEKYGSLFVFGTKENKNSLKIKAQNQVHEDGKLKSTHITGIDYAKLKLFLLSILWRASISSRPFFKQINLGDYEDKIRQMLLNGSPGTQLDFPCVINVIEDKKINKISENIISSPTKFSYDSCMAYQFQIGRIVLMFFILPAGMPEFTNKLAVNEKGEMRVLHIQGKIAEKHIQFILGNNVELYKYLLRKIN